MRHAVELLGILAIWLGLCGPVQAHRVLMRVTTPDNGPVVLVEVFYDDGKVAAQAEVQVQDEKKNEIAAGKTDAEGKWTFSRPEAAGLYRVFVNAGAGHRTRDSVYLGPDGDVSAPSKESLLGDKWLGLVGGLLAIGALMVAYWVWRRARMRASRNVNGDESL